MVALLQPRADDVVQLVGVADGEAVNADGHRLQPQVGQHGHLVLQHGSLGRNQQDLHFPLITGFLLSAEVHEFLCINLDFVDIEGDVFVRLETDGVVQVVFRHLHHVDESEDHRLATHRGDNSLGAKTTCSKQVVDRILSRLLTREIHLRVRGDNEVVLVLRDLNCLDAIGSDVQTDDALSLLQHPLPRGSSA